MITTDDNNSDIVQELTQLKSELETKRQQRDQYAGQLKANKERLEADYRVSSIEEAETLWQEMEQEIKTMSEDLQKKREQLQAQIQELKGRIK